MKNLAKVILAGVVIVALLQFVRPSIPTPPATAEVQAPSDVRHVLEKDCTSCHSNQRRLEWFDEIVPAYWLVRHDILSARRHLDFSTLGAKPAGAQKAALFEAVNMMQLGAMPLHDFVALHPDARVTPDDLATLKSYLAPWSTPAAPPSGAQGDNASAAPVSLAAVQPELDGFPFDPDFESWKLISITDRGDNNTFRFILGNDIAVQAARSGNISPWPDGARFAKIAWQQQQGADGLVHPGAFVQVELMVKDAGRYRSTDGWGWGRWRGLNLHPYGDNAQFVNECTGCHLPVRGDDYVYTLPVTSARVSGNEVVNTNAALPASLPYQPLIWSPVTLLTDRTNLTTSVLFANQAAITAFHPRDALTASAPEAPAYPPGAVLALVTWAQRDDPHWFGARIPDRPLTVEFVEVAASPQASRYRRFDGTDLHEDGSSPSLTTERLKFILGLPPARLP